MRVGQNPAKKVSGVVKPERITIAVLNYIPFIGGFYTEMLDVLKVCLNSIYENTELPFDLLVFDNGSCEEVVQYLVEERNAGNIQYLILSEKNLGKGGAWNIILDGAPGEIISYADNDIYFKKGWLKASMEILETYPNVGMVTARPIRTEPEYRSASPISATLDWCQAEAEVEITDGVLIPWESYQLFNLSLGKTEDLEEKYHNGKDWRIKYQGVSAFAGASHWQFTAKKEVLKRFLPFNMERPMGQVSHLDQHMDEEGYLRLMTTDSFAVNLSNSLQESPEVPELQNRTDNGTEKSGTLGGMQRILQFWLIKKVLLKLYDKLFDWYFRSDVQD